MGFVVETVHKYSCSLSGKLNLAINTVQDFEKDTSGKCKV